MAFLYAGRHQPGLEQMRKEQIHDEAGVRQLARDASRFDNQQRIVEQFALPAELVQVVALVLDLTPSRAACGSRQSIQRSAYRRRRQPRRQPP